MRRSVSSTDLPTGKSFMVIWRTVPCGSMMKSPLQDSKTKNTLATPSAFAFTNSHRVACLSIFCSGHTRGKRGIVSLGFCGPHKNDRVKQNGNLMRTTKNLCGRKIGKDLNKSKASLVNKMLFTSEQVPLPQLKHRNPVKSSCWSRKEEDISSLPDHLPAKRLLFWVLASFHTKVLCSTSGKICFPLAADNLESRMFSQFGTYFPGSVDPGKVAEVWICGNAHDLSVKRLELVKAVTECNDFGGTHERAVSAERKLHFGRGKCVFFRPSATKSGRPCGVTSVWSSCRTPLPHSRLGPPSGPDPPTQATTPPPGQIPPT